MIPYINTQEMVLKDKNGTSDSEVEWMIKYSSIICLNVIAISSYHYPGSVNSWNILSECFRPDTWLVQVWDRATYFPQEG